MAKCNGLVRKRISAADPPPAVATAVDVMQTAGYAQVLTLPSFPVSVLGTVVNKRARYSYLRNVDAAESLTYRWALPPAGGALRLTCLAADDQLQQGLTVCNR
eukprot:GHRQ01029127.1.p2 GENE.GHRQ01029127.1~~GHRQ01029127.1.p2  ORF type:complete len:103 (-),score=30.68 GHRQ01029127.1:324-632(-)